MRRLTFTRAEYDAFDCVAAVLTGAMISDMPVSDRKKLMNLNSPARRLASGSATFAKRVRRSINNAVSARQGG